MITIDRAFLLPDGTPDAKLLQQLLRMHAENCARLERLKDAYSRDHKIAGRVRLRGLPNNRLAHDLPGYIVTMAAGYLVGSPVQYTPQKGEEEAFASIGEAYKAAKADSVDAELAVDAAVYGKGMEICYADSGAQPRVAQISPLNAFVVYDDTVEHAPLLGVTIAQRLDESLKRKGERVCVYTAHEAVHFERISRELPRQVGRERHFFGGVPLTEYWNNAREEGDFEPVMDLIDAYDVLQSDRVNDKQQFTDSILALYGVGGLSEEDTVEYGPGPGPAGSGLPSARDAWGEHGGGEAPADGGWGSVWGEDGRDEIPADGGWGSGWDANGGGEAPASGEMGSGWREDGWDENERGEAPEAPERTAAEKRRLTPSQRLRQTKTLFMPADGARAEWLTKPLAEGDTEILRKSLKDDIHKLCFVPDLTDESFAGNVSGVAMRFKLLGLEQLTRMKERWFREGLRARLRLFAAFLETRGAAKVDVDSVQVSFRRSLPINELEIAQTLATYDGLVPRGLLLSQVPFVEDAEEAARMMGGEGKAQADGKRGL